jgi:hypothetical protein
MAAEAPRPYSTMSKRSQSDPLRPTSRHARHVQAAFANE